MEDGEVLYLILFSLVCVYVLFREKSSKLVLVALIDMVDKARKYIKILQLYLVVYDKVCLNSENGFPVYVLSARIAQ